MPQASAERKKMNWSVRLLAWLIIAAGGIHAIIDISEFYKVSIEKNISGYSWGSVNDNPWYYSSPSTYAAYCLVSAIIFIIAVGFAVYSLATRKDRYTQYAVAIFFLMQITSMISRLIDA
jgi:hypothetical protein